MENHIHQTTLICSCGDHLQPHSTHRMDRVQFYCPGCDERWELQEIEKMEGE